MRWLPRRALLCLALYLSWGPLVAVLPLPYAGGFVKLIVTLLGGALFSLHALAMAGYGSAIHFKLATQGELRVPMILSAGACAALLLPVLAGAPAAWRLTAELDAAFGPVEQPLPPFSLVRWLAPPAACATETAWPYPNRTITTRRFAPKPFATPEAPHLWPTTLSLWTSLFENATAAERHPGRLELVFWSAPPQQPLQRQGKQRRRPLLIFVHGGGWWTGNREGSYLGCNLDAARALGWHVATVEYRLAKDGWSGEAMASDVMAATNTLLRRARRLGVDRRRVVLVGSSAGGHLALRTAYDLNRRRGAHAIAAVASFGGAADLRLSLRAPVSRGAWDEAAAVRLLCGKLSTGTASEPGACERHLDPASLVSRHAPPTLLFHCGHDEYFSPAHPAALGGALERAGVPHAIVRSPLAPHACEGGEAGLGSQLARHALDHLLRSVAA